MLYHQNLEEIVFNRHQIVSSDEMVIISGYVGPAPINRLKTLPFKTTVIYGMYGCDGIGKALHETLNKQNESINNVDILYSTIPVHAKCYIWKKAGKVVHALIGSANFSTNGLETPNKEVLAETTVDTFDPLDNYLSLIKSNCIPCAEGIIRQHGDAGQQNYGYDWTNYDQDVCSLPLYIENGTQKEVPERSGLNWGMAKLSGSHVNINDAYIPLRRDFIEHYPTLFPPKQSAPSNAEDVVRADHRHNDSVDIIWDDGTTMKGLLEGSQPLELDGRKLRYPKQFATTPQKAELGKYIRNRMGIPEGRAITIEDLRSYGRDTIDVSMQGEGIYYFDFSPETYREKMRIKMHIIPNNDK